MDPDTETIVDTDEIRVYKSGRVERFIGNDFRPPGVYPESGVTCKDVVIDKRANISVRIFVPDLGDLRSRQKKLPVVVYCHGGGYCVLSPWCTVFSQFAANIVAKANVIVVSVDYRLAPEFPLPIAHEDSFVALKWVMSNPADEEWLTNYGDFTRVFLAGDSAGANIAHHMALKAKGMGIKGIALIHPFFWSKEATEELSKRDKLMAEKLEKLWKMVRPDSPGLDDPLINPFAEGAPSLRGLACERLLVLVAEHDKLKDMGMKYYEEVKKSGWKGEVEVFESEGEGHGFYVIKPDSEKTMELLQYLADFFNE